MLCVFVWCAQCSSPKYGDLKLSSAAIRHPLILHHPQMVEGVEPVGDESTTSWLYDFYPNVLGWVWSNILSVFLEFCSGVFSLKHPHFLLVLQLMMFCVGVKLVVFIYGRHMLLASAEWEFSIFNL